MGRTELFFMDACHLVYKGFLGYLWSFGKFFVKTYPGKKRINVLGSYNPIKKSLVSFADENNINANSIIKMLHKLRYACKTKPIKVILDNARYQHCLKVIKKAAQLNIELVFLPPYSPNLNIIERLWKYLKSKCLSSRNFENSNIFFDCIKEFLIKSNTDEITKNQISNLLALNFQTFKS